MLALVKGSERYVFLYNETNRANVLRTLGRYASNPDLSFTWYDAAVLSQKIRQEAIQPTPTTTPSKPHISENQRPLPISREKDIR